MKFAGCESTVYTTVYDCWPQRVFVSTLDVTV